MEGKTVMNNIWMIAEAGENTENAKPEVITAQDIDGAANQETGTLTQTADPNSAAAPVGKKPAQYSNLIFIVLIFALLYFVMFRGPKKKQQKQQQMIKSLKKNDKVQTIGGIFGTVLDVSENEITLKIDEANNTKIKVLATAVSRVIEQK